MKFGIVLPHQYPKEDNLARRIDELVLLTETVRDLGYSSIFGLHHYLASLATLQPFELLARLLPHAGQMQIGTAVYLATVDHPVQLAERAATLDQLSGGRLLLGLGAGQRPEEFKAFGIDRATRWARFAEMLEVIRALWTGEVVHHSGDHFEIDGQAISVTPAQPGGPPIWIGANAPATIRRAARLGDSWPAPPNVKVRWAVGNLAEFKAGLEERGVDPRGREYPIMRELFVAGGTGSGLDQAVGHIRQEYLELSKSRLDYMDSMFDELRVKAFAFGGASQVTDMIGRLADSGFNHFIFRVSWGRMPLSLTLESLRRFAAAVMPQFQDPAAAP